MKKCPKCEASLPDEVKFCSKCGTEIKTQAPSPTPAPKSEPKKEPKKSGKKWFLWLIIGLMVIGGTTFGLIYIFKEEKGEDKSQENVNVRINENLNKNVNVNANKNTNLNKNANANLNKNVNVNKNVNQQEDTEDLVNPLRPPLPEVTVTASSTLIDTTGLGFDYSPGQVIDQDFSTSWVEDVEDEGIGEWIKMEFPGTAEINTLGLVPGYARDTDIYQENNRVKNYELEFSDGTKITGELPDTYGLHFIEFSTVETTYIKLTIKGVHKGTKYNDTCIAELDIWSDYVINKDSEAALNYYKTYKEASAVKPKEKYIDKTYMAIGIMGSSTPEIPVDFYSSPAIEPLIAAAELPADTPSGKKFTAKWYYGNTLFHTQDITSYTASGQNKIVISSSTYISDLLDPPNVIWSLGDYKVEWYEDGKLSTTVNFAIYSE